MRGRARTPDNPVTSYLINAVGNTLELSAPGPWATEDNLQVSSLPSKRTLAIRQARESSGKLAVKDKAATPLCCLITCFAESHFLYTSFAQGLLHSGRGSPLKAKTRFQLPPRGLSASCGGVAVPTKCEIRSWDRSGPLWVPGPWGLLGQHQRGGQCAALLRTWGGPNTSMGITARDVLLTGAQGTTWDTGWRVDLPPDPVPCQRMPLWAQTTGQPEERRRLRTSASSGAMTRERV